MCKIEEKYHFSLILYHKLRRVVVLIDTMNFFNQGNYD